MTYKVGDKPGKGAYRCVRCGFLVHIYDDDDKLQACPACMHTEFVKVES